MSENKPILSGLLLTIAFCTCAGMMPRCEAASESLFFAHVVAGSGYSTVFTLANTGATRAAGTLAISFPVTMTGTVTGTNSSFDITLDPGATAVFTASRGELASGWARLETSGGAVSGVATFQLGANTSLQTIAGVLGGDAVEAAVIPVNNDASQERYTGFAVANAGAVDVHLTIVLRAEDGSTAGPALVRDEINPLKAQAQLARFVHQYDPALAKFRGSMTITAQPGEKFSVVALTQHRQLYTAIPVIPAIPQPAGWRLVWSDEFNGADNSSPDASKWGFDVGTGSNGWGNNELEYYTTRPENARLEAGNLIITARQENYQTRSYTSARILTKGKFEQKYGRIEARLKVPFGQGLWPAFWMLGNDIDTARWPACGEIDIMENVGKEPSIAHFALHGPGYSGGSPLGAAYTLPGGQRFADGFHVFAVEWEPAEIRWYVDGTQYKAYKSTDIPGGTRWVYDHPFFILLNVAVGGNWPGSPDSTTVFPQTMTVDYVRVYERNP